MLKLYYFQGACALVPHIALEWTGQPYEIEPVSHDKLHSPEFLKLNPMGAVPCLTDGDFILTQNVAILEYIDDLFPDANLFGGQSAKARAETRKWLSILNSDLHPAFGHLFRLPMLFKEDKYKDELRNFAINRIRSIYGIIDKQLEGKDYITGVKSVADPYLYVSLGWADALGVDVSDFPNIQKFKASFAKDEGVVKAQKAQAQG